MFLIYRNDEDQLRWWNWKRCRSSRLWRPSWVVKLKKLSFIEVMKTKLSGKIEKVVVHRGYEDQLRWWNRKSCRSLRLWRPIETVKSKKMSFIGMMKTNWAVKSKKTSFILQYGVKQKNQSSHLEFNEN